MLVDAMLSPNIKQLPEVTLSATNVRLAWMADDVRATGLALLNLFSHILVSSRQSIRGVELMYYYHH